MAAWKEGKRYKMRNRKRFQDANGKFYTPKNYYWGIKLNGRVEEPCYLTIEGKVSFEGVCLDVSKVSLGTRIIRLCGMCGEELNQCDWEPCGEIIGDSVYCYQNGKKHFDSGICLHEHMKKDNDVQFARVVFKEQDARIPKRIGGFDGKEHIALFNNQG